MNNSAAQTSAYMHCFQCWERVRGPFEISSAELEVVAGCFVLSSFGECVKGSLIIFSAGLEVAVIDSYASGCLFLCLILRAVSFSLRQCCTSCKREGRGTSALRAV